GCTVGGQPSAIERLPCQGADHNWKVARLGGRFDDPFRSLPRILLPNNNLSILCRCREPAGGSIPFKLVHVPFVPPQSRKRFQLSLAKCKQLDGPQIRCPRRNQVLCKRDEIREIAFSRRNVLSRLNVPDAEVVV